jgi:hypothetical protein
MHHLQCISNVYNRDSYYLEKHIYLLQSHLLSHTLSFTPLSYPKYDDSPGLSGLVLHEHIYEALYLQHCLYTYKGEYDYILVIRPSQHIVSAADTTLSDMLVRYSKMSTSRSGATGANIAVGKFTRYPTSGLSSTNTSSTSSGSSPRGNNAVLSTSTIANRNMSIEQFFSRSRAKSKYNPSLHKHHSHHSHSKIASSPSSASTSVDSGTSRRLTESSTSDNSSTSSCSILLSQGYVVADPADAFFPPGDYDFAKG